MASVPSVLDVWASFMPAVLIILATLIPSQRWAADVSSSCVFAPAQGGEHNKVHKCENL